MTRFRLILGWIVLSVVVFAGYILYSDFQSDLKYSEFDQLESFGSSGLIGVIENNGKLIAKPGEPCVFWRNGNLLVEYTIEYQGEQIPVSKIFKNDPRIKEIEIRYIDPSSGTIKGFYISLPAFGQPRTRASLPFTFIGYSH